MIDQAPEQRVWYLRREGKLAGPFNSARIRRLLLEGQVALNDEVSVDRKTWQPIARVAELVPPGLRGGADATTVGNEAANPIPWVALTVFVLLVAGAIGFAFWWGGSPPQSVPDCNAEAGAGVDWRNCRLPGLQAQGADLRSAILQNADLRAAALAGADLSGAQMDYADLTSADLAYAVLKGVSLRGASLRGADLVRTDLSGSDLRFADLTDAVLSDAVFEGVRLDRAIWTDGRVCATPSVGQCAR